MKRFATRPDIIATILALAAVAAALAWLPAPIWHH